MARLDVAGQQVFVPKPLATRIADKRALVFVHTRDVRLEGVVALKDLVAAIPRADPFAIPSGGRVVGAHMPTKILAIRKHTAALGAGRRMV